MKFFRDGIKSRLRRALILAAAALLFTAVQGHALLVTTSFEGTVTLDNGGVNPFGLFLGDTISGTVIYDDALVTGTSADEDIAVAGNAGWDFTIDLGTFSFSQSDVTDPAYTLFYFNFSSFDGIEFFIEPIDIGTFTNLLFEDFNGGRSLFVEDASSGTPIYLEADWDFANATTPVPVSSPGPIPEPATILLMGLGLLGIGHFFRKRFNI